MGLVVGLGGVLLGLRGVLFCLIGLVRGVLEVLLRGVEVLGRRSQLLSDVVVRGLALLERRAAGLLALLELRLGGIGLLLRVVEIRLGVQRPDEQADRNEPEHDTDPDPRVAALARNLILRSDRLRGVRGPARRS